MPEANDINFCKAEEQIQKLQTFAMSLDGKLNPDDPATNKFVVTRHLQNAVKAVVSAVTDNPVHRIDVNPDNTIRVVHYTSMANIIAALENHGDGDDWRLRMYHTAGFNDKAEGQYLFEGYGLAKAIEMGLMPANTRQNPPQNEKDNEHHAYAVCFVTPKVQGHDYSTRPDPPEADNATFWSASYGEKGYGVALTVTLEPRILYRVQYGHEQAKKTATQVAQYCERILDAISQLKPVALDIHEYAKRIIQEELTLLRYLYKDQTFADERECRAISICRADDENIRTELIPGKVMFKSYYRSENMSAGKLFRTGSSITLGPCVRNRASAMLHIRQLVKKSPYPHVYVWASESSYGSSENR